MKYEEFSLFALGWVEELKGLRAASSQGCEFVPALLQNWASMFSAKMANKANISVVHFEGPQSTVHLRWYVCTCTGWNGMNLITMIYPPPQTKQKKKIKSRPSYLEK